MNFRLLIKTQKVFDVEEVDDDNVDIITKCNITTNLSTLPTDLPIGINTFCTAFPWHFIVDNQLDFVQLGTGFASIIGNKLDEIGKFL